jgi:hypothetical protein
LYSGVISDKFDFPDNVIHEATDRFLTLCCIGPVNDIEVASLAVIEHHNGFPFNENVIHPELSFAATPRP